MVVKFRGRFQDLADTHNHLWTRDFEARSAREAKRMATKWANANDVLIYVDPEEVRGDHSVRPPVTTRPVKCCRPRLPATRA